MPVLGVAGNIVTLKRVNPQKWSRKKRKKRLKRPAKVAPVVQKLVVPAKGGEKNPIRRYTAYALELEDGYYYVGITARHDVNVRYIEHSNAKGSKWTRLHKPRSVIETSERWWLLPGEGCSDGASIRGQSPYHQALASVHSCPWDSKTRSGRPDSSVRASRHRSHSMPRLRDEMLRGQ